MVYLLNIIVSVGYSYIVRKNKKMRFNVYIPIILLWILILGGQDGVGTDYYSYKKIYEEHHVLERFYNVKEYLFYYFIIFFSKFIKNGQFLFFFDSLLKTILFFIILKKTISNKYSYIFIFLYLSYSTIFYNQMNGIRNYLAGYFFTLGVIYLIKNQKKIFFLLLGIGNFIHKTCLYMFSIFFINKQIKKNIDNKKIYIFLFLGIIIAFLPLKEMIGNTVGKIIPTYSHYFTSQYYKNEMEIINKIARIVWFPFYINSVMLIGNNLEGRLIKYGILGYFIKLFTIAVPIFSRLAIYFSILEIYPIFYLIIYYLKTKKILRLFFLVFLIFIFIISKILIFPKGEYLYKAIYF